MKYISLIAKYFSKNALQISRLDEVKEKTGKLKIVREILPAHMQKNLDIQCERTLKNHGGYTENP